MNIDKSKLQVGVIGSMTDVDVSDESQQMAENLGQAVAKAGAVLFYSHEGDYESLPTLAAKAAREAGAQTVGFLWSDGVSNLPSGIHIHTGQRRGGGREFSFINSCDAIIAIGGGSGTLMEIAMAYQAGIPILAFANHGGWAANLSGKYVDSRERLLIQKAYTIEDVVNFLTTLNDGRL